MATFPRRHLTSLTTRWCWQALGVLNTFLSTRVSQITAADKLGTLFGLFESVEKLAGIGGPLVGGALAQAHDDLPMVVVTVRCHF